MQAVVNLLHNPRISVDDLLKVVLLYHLRYEQAASNATKEFIEMLLERGASREHVQMIERMIMYGGAER